MSERATVAIGFCREVSLSHAITTLIREGFDVVAFDSVAFAPGLKVSGLREAVVDERIAEDEAHYLDFLTDLGRSHPGAVLLTGDDYTSRLIARHQQVLSEHFRFLAPAYPLYMRVADKYELSRLVAETGLSAPPCRPLGDGEPGSLSYPLMLKPRLGAGGRGQVKCVSDGELRGAVAALAKREDYFLQEYVPGPLSNLFSVTLLMDRRSEPVCAFSANRLNVFCSRRIPEGATTFLRSVRLAREIDDSIAFLKRIGWIGIAELEFKKDDRDGRLKLLEINPRLWSWARLASIAGVDFTLHYVRAAAQHDGSESAAGQLDFREDVYYLRPLSDLYANVWRLRSGQLSWREFVRACVFRARKALAGQLHLETFENPRSVYSYMRQRGAYV